MITTYIVIIVTTLILLNLYVMVFLSENLYSNEKINMYAKANIIAETVSEVWGNDDSATASAKIEPFVEGSLAGTSVRGVVTNNSYTVMYDTNKESHLVGRVFMRDVLNRALNGEQSESLTDYDNNMRILCVAVPIEINGGVVGGVYLAKSVNSLEATISQTRTRLFIFSALIVLIIGMLSFGMSYIILSPLQRFKQVAAKISKGDFSERIKVKGRSEIDQMGETLNYMCDELELLEEKRRKFVSDASHELKTPMAGIKLICDSLVSAENLDPEMVKEFLRDMSDEVD
ncbi:MAG: HAMP domain-containing protein, partial [Clostridia bacterium]|nr:HAMP domain-containing protein [Clostridia bacterium]